MGLKSKLKKAVKSAVKEIKSIPSNLKQGINSAANTLYKAGDKATKAKPTGINPNAPPSTGTTPVKPDGFAVGGSGVTYNRSW